ncbi:MAG: PorT family protein [Saprospiraceae bacterium]|nr:PorT family protein [Saprospiraceae bacterium]
MKKTILLFAGMLIFTVAGIAQVSLRPQIGIKTSDLSYQTVQGELQGKSGYIVGVDLQLGHPFYIQPGININPEKLQIKNVGDVAITKVNVPILLGFKFFEPSYDKTLGVRLFAGPNFAYNVSNSISGAITGIDVEDLKKFNLSGIAGAGVDLSIFFVDLGYNFGFSEAITPPDGVGVKINYLLINAGLRIGF